MQGYTSGSDTHCNVGIVLEVLEEYLGSDRRVMWKCSGCFYTRGGVTYVQLW